MEEIFTTLKKPGFDPRSHLKITKGPLHTPNTINPYGL